MLEALASARLWLGNLDPAAPVVTLMLSIFLIIYSIRRWFPRAWIWVEATVPFVDKLDYRPAATILWKAWQSWPAVALGATVTALSNGGSPVAALKGAALGAAVAVIHEIASAYKGRLGTPKPKTPNGGSSFVGLLAPILTLVLACGLPGCSLFGPGGSVWPKVGTCAPTSASLLSKVEAVLTGSTGDYEAELVELGKVEGFAFVECAVQAIVQQLSAHSRASERDVLGFTRGKVFLSKIEAEQ